MKLRWRIAWFATYPWAKLLLGLRVFGRRKLTRGAQIIAANHTSNFDPLVVGWAAAREIHFLAKEELFTAKRVFAWLIRSWNAWPVRRGGSDAAAIRQCCWLLGHGQVLVLFPEGTRSGTGEMARFKPGIGLLALTSGVPVVPTHIGGMAESIVSYWVDRDFVRRGLRRRPGRPSGITVRFGEPVLPGGFSRNRDGYQALAAEVEARVRGLAACRG
ncbi:MAG: lysophospholipid acyltransferase family protein [candidate division WOR-3 bacterium]